MPLQWDLESDQGGGGKLSSQDIFQQLQAKGENPTGISADGQTMTLQDGQGTFEVKTHDLLQGLGWKVAGVAPENAVQDFAREDWRAAVAALPNDDIRKAYLKESVGKMGMKDASIVGSENDWYVYSPEQNKYYAMTNKEGMDMTDVAGFGQAAPAFIGGVAGGALGSAGGPLGTAAGAGAGSALGGAASRAAIAGYDPTYRRLASENLGAVAGDIGQTAGIDALTGGIAHGAPGLLAKIPGTNIASKLGRGVGSVLGAADKASPLASTARYGGALAEEGGALAGKGFGFLAQPGAGRQIGASFLPGAAELDMAGLATQLPGGALRAAGDLYAGLGGQAGKQFGRRVQMEQALGTPGKTLGQSVRNWWKGTEGMEPRYNLESLGREFGREFAGGGGRDAIRNKILRQAEINRYGKVAPEGFMGPRQQMMDPMDALKEARAGVQPTIDRTRRWGDMGASLGRGLGKLERGGEAAERLATKTAGGIARAGQMGSEAISGAGSMARKAGTALQPYEGRSYLQYGAEEAASPFWEDYWKRQNRVVPSGQTLA